MSLRCCAAIRSAHSPAFEIPAWPSLLLSDMTQLCGAWPHVGKRGSSDAYRSKSFFSLGGAGVQGFSGLHLDWTRVKVTPENSQRDPWMHDAARRSQQVGNSVESQRHDRILMRRLVQLRDVRIDQLGSDTAGSRLRAGRLQLENRSCLFSCTRSEPSVPIRTRSERSMSVFLKSSPLNRRGSPVTLANA